MAVKPVKKPKGQDYANPDNLYRWNYHAGIDYPTPTGTAIHAPAKGTFKYLKGYNGGYGNTIQVVTRFGFKHWITHASKRVGKNRKVKQNEVIGRTGNTGLSSGPHAHWEVRWENKDVDPELWVWIERTITQKDKAIAQCKTNKENIKKQLSNTQSALNEALKRVESLSKRPTQEEVEKLKQELKTAQSDLEQANKDIEAGDEGTLRRFFDFLINLFKKG